MSEQEMIERYIYEVVRRVPSEAREEIRMEIGALIEDMQNGEGLSVQAVLEKLGDPAVFARRYRGDRDYLIGPEYYDDYVWILKLVLIGIGISAVVSALINGFMGMESRQVSGWVRLFVIFFTDFFENVFSGALGDALRTQSCSFNASAISFKVGTSPLAEYPIIHACITCSICSLYDVTS